MLLLIFFSALVWDAPFFSPDPVVVCGGLHFTRQTDGFKSVICFSLAACSRRRGGFFVFFCVVFSDDVLECSSSSANYTPQSLNLRHVRDEAFLFQREEAPKAASHQGWRSVIPWAVHWRRALGGLLPWVKERGGCFWRSLEGKSRRINFLMIFAEDIFESGKTGHWVAS